MNKNNKINYVEFAANDLAATKKFFTDAFRWQCVDCGPDYTAFSEQGVDGGFYRANMSSSSANGGALVILFSDSLEDTLSLVTSAGGVIIKPIFAFPGGRRFHFTEPSGNELAVWGEIS